MSEPETYEGNFECEPHVQPNPFYAVDLAEEVTAWGLLTMQRTAKQRFPNREIEALRAQCRTWEQEGGRVAP